MLTLLKRTVCGKSAFNSRVTMGITLSSYIGFVIALQLPYIALDKVLKEHMNVTYIFMNFQSL